MNNVLKAIIMAAIIATGMHQASAADVGGNVKTNVKTGIILQMNKGIANKNTIVLGSVTGKKTDVDGNFRSYVRTGAIIQANTGIANRNKVTIGSITR